MGLGCDLRPSRLEPGVRLGWRTGILGPDTGLDISGSDSSGCVSATTKEGHSVWLPPVLRYPARVNWLESKLWRISSKPSSSFHRNVLEPADALWTECIADAREILGEPGYCGAPDGPGFPVRWQSWREGNLGFKIHTRCWRGGHRQANPRQPSGCSCKADSWSAALKAKPHSLISASGVLPLPAASDHLACAWRATETQVDGHGLAMLPKTLLPSENDFVFLIQKDSPRRLSRKR